MNEQEKGPETELEPKEVGNEVMRMVAWFAVAVVILVIVLGFFVLRAMGIF
jgi:hypothetical protein